MVLLHNDKEIYSTACNVHLMVLNRSGVRAVVDHRAGRLDVILVGELRLELVLLEVVELGLAADDGSANLAMHGNEYQTMSFMEKTLSFT